MYGSTQVESPICRARSQICTQYRLGVRFVRVCHLALDQHSSWISILFSTFNLKKQLFKIVSFILSEINLSTFIIYVHLYNRFWMLQSPLKNMLSFTFIYNRNIVIFYIFKSAWFGFKFHYSLPDRIPSKCTRHPGIYPGITAYWNSLYIGGKIHKKNSWTFWLSGIYFS